MSTVSIDRFVTGPLDVNTFLVHDTAGGCMLVDPSRGLTDVAAFAREHRLVPRAICLSHAHFDHIMGIDEAEELFGTLPVWLNARENDYLTDPQLNGSVLIGEELTFSIEPLDLCVGEHTIGGIRTTAIDVAGHSRGGMALLFDKDCLVGDAVFAGSIGRTDFPGSNHQQLIANIRTGIMSLPDDTVLHPGHGGRTTVGRERRMNPYL